MEEEYVCPVSGFPELDDPPYYESGNGSLEICPSCGIQFGYTDWTRGDLVARQALHNEWRRRWIAEGMPWDRGRSEPPPGWDPKHQLRAIGVDPDAPEGRET